MSARTTTGFYLTTGAITCMDCRRVSYDPTDRVRRWCGLCGLHHPDRAAALTPGALALRRYPDGRVAVVYPLSFGTARILVHAPGGLEAAVAEHVYHYPGPLAAINGVRRWDGTGEPGGWHHHSPSGRRRSQGDPRKEHVR